MDRRNNLILHDGKNLTATLVSCRYNSATRKYDITFQGGKTYSYNYSSIQWLRNPKSKDPSTIQISKEGRTLTNIECIRVFHANSEDYWYICYKNNKEALYKSSELKITKSCLSDTQSQNCFEYLKQLAAISNLKSDDGKVLLAEQYSKVESIDADSVLAHYLHPNAEKLCTYDSSDLIFPFGGNASQFRAVENAMNNQLSVIQGPPGTGKTQTILNIIANLLISNKTVQVVSNNNSATVNVQEKLSSPKYGLGFLVAALGCSENKKLFIESQSGTYPDFSDWKVSTLDQIKLKQEIKKLKTELTATFDKQERLAQANSESDALLLEREYFSQFCEDNHLNYASIKPRFPLHAKQLLRLWQQCEAFSEKPTEISFWFRTKAALLFGIADWKFYGIELPKVISLFQALFYTAKDAELKAEIKALNSYLKDVDAKGKMDRLTALSMRFLRAVLYQKYSENGAREQFTIQNLQKNGQRVVEEYPIVLSTTFSSHSCLKGVMYDYLIMDEASQVDIATAALALAGAKNAVIVGDLKQLPNVITREMREQSDAVFKSFHLPCGYAYSDNSFLKSVCTVLPEAPQTLLREHYRCHPKIIGFCNQKFYHNELLIMTEDHGEEDAITVFKTVSGNHRRDHINQRQIDVLTQEALPKFADTKPSEIGVIAPYRKQANSIAAQLPSADIEADTVHKFQGREKDTIILTTVDDVVTDFSDDPYLLNVAVSRAKKRLCVITSGDEQPKDSNIGDLIAYIQYNKFQVVQSEIYSVFDLLYRQYTDERIEFLKKHARVSRYDSENLMFGYLTDLLKKHPNLPFNIVCHQPLYMLIRDAARLSEEEYHYAMNTATHLDFFIYNAITKKPIAAVEVDGFHNHKPGTRQYERDRMKDAVLQKYDIELLRFSTAGSGEISRLEAFLCEYENKNAASEASAE